MIPWRVSSTSNGDAPSCCVRGRGSNLPSDFPDVAIAPRMRCEHRRGPRGGGREIEAHAGRPCSIPCEQAGAPDRRRRGLADPMTFEGLRTMLPSAAAEAHAIAHGGPEDYERRWKGGRTSGRGFMNSDDQLSESADEDFADFSKLMTRHGPCLNGFLPVMRRPRRFKLYIGCPTSLRSGWRKTCFGKRVWRRWTGLVRDPDV